MPRNAGNNQPASFVEELLRYLVGCMKYKSPSTFTDESEASEPSSKSKSFTYIDID